MTGDGAMVHWKLYGTVLAEMLGFSPVRLQGCTIFTASNVGCSTSFNARVTVFGSGMASVAANSLSTFTRTVLNADTKPRKLRARTLNVSVLFFGSSDVCNK